MKTAFCSANKSIIHLEIGEPDFPYQTIVTERYDPTKHFADNIFGRASWFKGLGEMNPEQLWETTMDPKNRILRKVEIDDEVEVDEYFSILMGDKVEPRRDFITAHAHEVRNLDI